VMDRKKDSIRYKDYLRQIIELVKKVKNTGETKEYPDEINSKAKRSLYDNLDNNEELAVSVHKSIIKSRQDGWIGNHMKEKKIRKAIEKTLSKYDIDDEAETEKILRIAENQAEYRA
ncbi:restriction endonuclease subunit R, partial [Candidatus Pacearchaeota archaeon]|nr:restriction endonuclease subunit R [Candidatus Pacearchaeota archaeon]